jgi:hypothetical protein
MGYAGFSRFAGIALVAVVSLAAAGDEVVYAFSYEKPNNDCSAVAGSVAIPLDITLSATLTGTLMVDGGRSLALFDPTGVIGVVREGEAFADGTILCEVQSDRIIVGRGGSRWEIFLGSKGQPTVAASPRSVSPAGAPTALATSSPPAENAQPASRASLLDLRVGKFHAMLERRQGQPAVQ